MSNLLQQINITHTNWQLEYVYEAKYLGFMLCKNKMDNCDMLRQLRILYAFKI